MFLFLILSLEEIAVVGVLKNAQFSSVSSDVSNILCVWECKNIYAAQHFRSKELAVNY